MFIHDVITGHEPRPPHRLLRYNAFQKIYFVKRTGEIKFDSFRLRLLKLLYLFRNSAENFSVSPKASLKVEKVFPSSAGERT